MPGCPVRCGQAGPDRQAANGRIAWKQGRLIDGMRGISGSVRSKAIWSVSGIRPASCPAFVQDKRLATTINGLLL